MDIIEIENKIKSEATSVLVRVVLFIIYYIVLILIGLGLFVAAFGVTWLIIQGLSEVTRINGRVVIWGFIAWLAMWWFCIQIAWYLIKPLFTFHSSTDENRVEVHKEDCPELFSMIQEIASATGNKMPKHVYLTSEVNACVFYNSTSIWAIFFPTRKNLMVGLGLLQGMNKDEVKAILAHEFGHFSQQTMKVGTISYRLLLIIRDMIEQAQEQQRSAALSRSSDNSWEKFFHLASGPISFITGKTIDFYNYIEKKNRSLSRYMEFEADAVACRIVGAKPFISSMSKLSVLSERYNLYENIIANLIGEQRHLSNYWKGYEYVDGLLSDDENIKVSYNDVLSAEIGDDSLYRTKIIIQNGWNTHPSTEERIESAKQFLNDSTSVDLTDARTIIPGNIANSVADIRQHFIAENLQEPVKWSDTKDMTLEDFCIWSKEQLSSRRVPHFLFPFTNKNVVGFAFPSDEEIEQNVESPFTQSNRMMLLEFQQGVNDWQTLNQLNDSHEAVTMLYEGSRISSVGTVIERHKAYLEPFNEKLHKLDIQIYKYLWQRAKNKTNLKIMYWALFFGNDGLRGMSDIRNLVDSIREQAHFYTSNGQSFSLRDDVRSQLANDFWKFMRSFDYNNVSRVCGNWNHGEETTVNQLIDKWYEFASKETTPYISTSDLFDMIDEVYGLVNHLYNLGKSQWTKRVINAYNGIEETEDPEPEAVEYDEIWDESLELISDGEKIRYKIIDFYQNLSRGEEMSPQDIFGENMSMDEYTEFLKVTTSLTGPQLITSKEELESSIKELETDPDPYIMKKIAYTYLADDVVEQNLKESTKWFLKAAELNDAEALDRVGGAYLHGAGIDQNPAMAVSFYKRAICADGYAEALLDLGLAYLKGDGVPQSDAHGFSLMIRSARQGNAAAQYNMGYIYNNGITVDIDTSEALKWYTLSANQGYEQAIDFLNKLKSES